MAWIKGFHGVVSEHLNKGCYMEVNGVAFNTKWAAGQINVRISAETHLRPLRNTGTIHASSRAGEYGGATGKMLFCRHGALPDCVIIIEVAQFIQQLVKQGPRELQDKIEALEKAKKRDSSKS